MIIFSKQLSVIPALAAGLSLLLSCVLSIFLFKIGVVVSIFHWLAIPCIYLVLIWFCDRKSRSFNVRNRIEESCLYAAVFVVALLLSRETIGTDFDGLFMHVEFVRALCEGWNPMFDPTFSIPETLDGITHPEIFKTKLDSGGYYLKYGQILGALIAKVFGLEAAKCINVLFAYFLLRSAIFLLHLWTENLTKAHLYALLLTLNPVILYQIPSFMHDGLVASTLSVMILSGVVFLRSNCWGTLVLYIVSAAILIGTKKSGLAYSLGFSLFYLLLYLLENFRALISKLKFLLILFFGAGLLVLVVLKSGLWDIRPVQLPLDSMLRERGRLVEKIKPTTVFDIYPEYREMDGLEQFVTTSFCQMNIAPDHPRWKFPGEIRLREIQNLYQAFTGYWIGGMGPLYGLILVTGSLASLFFVSVSPRRLKFWFYFVIPVICSVSVLPSLCVRWVPHIWLLCYSWIFALGNEENKLKGRNWIFCFRHSDRFANQVRQFSMIAAVANVSLILALTLAGQHKIKKIIDTQFDILRQIPGPAQVSFDWFPSNRFWFQDRGIEYLIVEGEKRKVVPFTNLYRTNTRVHISEEALKKKIRYPGTEKLVTVEGALRQLEETLPEDAYTWHWIRPLLVKYKGKDDFS